MADQYTVELGFNRPPEDIRRIERVLRNVVNQVDDNYIHLGTNKNDILYAADIMEEIANKMEQG